MTIIWTVDGDTTSWAEWAGRMALSPASPLATLVAADFHSSCYSWALDLGCGTGRAFLPLYESGFKIIGVDPIFTATKSSLERAKNENLLAFPVQATASRLPVPSNTVQLVLALGILFHLGPAELDDALQEIYRVLGEGGKTVLHFLDINDWRQNLARCVEADSLPVPGYHAVVTCFCSQDVIQSKILASGLKIEKDA